MNNILIAFVVAFAAGFGGAWIFGQTNGDADGAAAEGTGDSALLAEQIADLKREIQDLRNPPETLRASAAAGTPGSSEAAQAAVVEAVLAKLDERVDGRVTEKFEALASKNEGGSQRGRRRGGKKRVSLKDAASAIGLSAQEEDEVARIYEDSMNRFMKLAAGPDGDIEDVKRDLANAQKNPMGGRTLMMKYMPNMMKNMGELMTIQADRETAINKAIGPEKARRLNSEFDVKEGNPLGGGFRMEARMESDADATK